MNEFKETTNCHSGRAHDTVTLLSAHPGLKFKVNQDCFEPSEPASEFLIGRCKSARNHHSIETSSS